MSIEQLLQGVIEALNANTAALQGSAVKTTGTGTSGETGTASTGKGGDKGGDKKKGPTVEEMQAALTAVKEKFGAAEAKSIIKSAGGVEKMNEIPEKKVKAVFEAAQAKLTAEDDTTGSDDDI
jgi:hypothetical protein